MRLYKIIHKIKARKITLKERLESGLRIRFLKITEIIKCNYIHILTEFDR